MYIQERFDEKWMPVSETGCWLWMSGVSVDGYGKFWTKDEQLAHRASWKLHRGPIPDGLHVLHQCDTPCCVNPSHLFLGTNLDNMRDRDKKGRRNVVGVRNPFHKLTEEQVLEIRKASGTQTSIAVRYGIDQTLVSMIKLRKAWAHLN